MADHSIGRHFLCVVVLNQIFLKSATVLIYSMIQPPDEMMCEAQNEFDCCKSEDASFNSTMTWNWFVVFVSIMFGMTRDKNCAVNLEIYPT